MEDPQYPSLSKEVDLELGQGNAGMPLEQSADQQQQKTNECKDISATMNATQFEENTIQNTVERVSKPSGWFTKKFIASIIIIILVVIGISGGSIWYFYPGEARKDKDELPTKRTEFDDSELPTTHPSPKMKEKSDGDVQEPTGRSTTGAKCAEQNSEKTIEHGVEKLKEIFPHVDPLQLEAAFVQANNNIQVAVSLILSHHAMLQRPIKIEEKKMRIANFEKYVRNKKILQIFERFDGKSVRLNVSAPYLKCCVKYVVHWMPDDESTTVLLQNPVDPADFIKLKIEQDGIFGYFGKEDLGKTSQIASVWGNSSEIDLVLCQKRRIQ